MNAGGDWVREQINKAKSLTEKPFGVNIMLASPHAITYFAASMAFTTSPTDFISSVISREIPNASSIKAKSLTEKPFGVNIMLASPHVEEVARIVAEEHVAVVTTGAGIQRIQTQFFPSACFRDFISFQILCFCQNFYYLIQCSSGRGITEKALSSDGWAGGVSLCGNFYGAGCRAGAAQGRGAQGENCLLVAASGQYSHH